MSDSAGAPLSLSSHKRSPALFFLVLYFSVSSLGTDMYFSAFPLMATTLRVPEVVIQLSFSCFIIGVALGQLTIGPISDGTGRRPLLIAGTVVFSLASLACAGVQDGYTLLPLRFVQGFSAAAALVIGRAVVTDHYEPQAAARTFGTVMAFQGLSPVLAPIVGGTLIRWFGWRAVFLALFLIGVLMVSGALWKVPETLPPARRSGTSLRANFHRVAILLRERPFMRYVAVSCLTCAGFFAHVAGSPIVLHATYNLTEQDYTVFFTTNAVGMASSMAVGRSVLTRVSPRFCAGLGLFFTTFGAGALAAITYLGGAQFRFIWACLFVVTMGMGLLLPSLTILGQRAGARLPGTASALQGGLQFLGGAAMSPVTGLFPSTTIAPLATVMLCCMAGAVMVFVWPRRVPRVEAAP